MTPLRDVIVLAQSLRKLYRSVHRQVDGLDQASSLLPEKIWVYNHYSMNSHKLFKALQQYTLTIH